MNNDLDKVIDQIKLLSGGEKNNIDLPDDELLTKYEHDIGFTFPADYKKVLKEIGNVFYGTIELLSVTKDKKNYGELSQSLDDARKLGVPKDWLPICEDNGNYYCLLADGQVRYWSHDGYSDEMWSDITDWIQQVWINSY
ncbi:SMI1/KNR4 family protein [Photorhabdus tasmaniensis]|uniref:SMI1/KNR4 family protein n=1 Tax=Photorhabdus sp. RM323S TaxID=3342828 RepID=UPI0036DF9AF2